jgi:hypothetical protein
MPQDLAIHNNASFRPCRTQPLSCATNCLLPGRGYARLKRAGFARHPGQKKAAKKNNPTALKNVVYPGSLARFLAQYSFLRLTGVLTNTYNKV